MTIKTITRKYTPNRTIRHYCFECVGKQGWEEVEKCTCADKDKNSTNHCPFYKYRLGKGRVASKLFRAFCIQCTQGSSDTIRNCPATKCIIYPYRFGKNPHLKGRINAGSFKKATSEIDLKPI